MKNTLKNTLYFLSFLLVLGACDDKEFLELNENANSSVNLSVNTLVLTEDTASDDVLTVTWSEPSFGFDAADSYQILIDLAGGDFSAPQIVATGSDLEKVFSGEELNGKILALGLIPNTSTDIDLLVKTRLSDAQEMLSEKVTLNVTAFSSLLDLSTPWGLVGSATPGGWGNENVPDVPFYTTVTPGVFVSYATLVDGEIKIRKDNLWDTNYGDTGVDGVLDAGGDNIAVTAGTYKVTFDENELTYTIEDYSWGIVGSATNNGWDGPDFKLNYNSYQDDWKAVVTLKEGEVKFRLNNDWAVNHGGSGLSGALAGDNIAVTEGHYLVTLNLNTSEYEFEKIDVWGLVGSGTPNGWDGPDTKFVPDFGIDEGVVFYINGIVLVDGEIKVRQNDAWGLNYGDDENDGILENGGGNIPVPEAGTYNLVLSFAGSDPTLVLNKW